MGRVRAGSRSANPIAERARKAERELRALKPGANLPPEEIRETRREKRARLENQIDKGDESAKRAAEKILQREREDAKEREGLRAGRKRPHNHLPSGLVQLPFRETNEAGHVFVRPARKGDAGAKLAIGVRRSGSERAREPVTPELAVTAQTLRALFDLVPHEMSEGRFSMLPRMFVRPEIAQAVRAAGDIVRDVWISLLLELVTDARLHEEERVRRAVALSAGHRIPCATTPAEILRALEGSMRNLGFVRTESWHRSPTAPPLPDHVNENVVAWVLASLALGPARGGGPSAKLSAERMRKLLRHPDELVVAMKKLKHRPARAVRRKTLR